MRVLDTVSLVATFLGAASFLIAGFATISFFKLATFLGAAFFVSFSTLVIYFLIH